MKIWTCGNSLRSGSRNAWTRIKTVNGVSRLSNFWIFFRRNPNDFLSRLVTMDETWLYHYDPETKQQSMEWPHSAHSGPKKLRAQKFAGKFSPRFFGIKTASSSLIIFQRANYQRGVLLISASATEGHFEGKIPREGHQGGLVLARQCPVSPGTCNPEETDLPGLLFSWPPTPPSGSGPGGLPSVSWTEKQLKFHHFSSDAEVNVAAETWLGGQISDFLLLACKR